MSNLANVFAVRPDWRDDGHGSDGGPALAGEPSERPTTHPQGPGLQGRR